jgi:S-adenosylmethionine:diacylglycerol 3-amino-3-carboxypropyl transferase
MAMMPVLLVTMLAFAMAQSPPLGRALTAGERGFLAPLFGDSIDYEAIRIVRGRVFPLMGSRTVVTLGEVVYAPVGVYCDDFAHANVERQALLVHEVAHVWQHTNGVRVVTAAVRTFVATAGRYGRAYRYELADGRDLADYGIEQQATILEHYFLARGETAARFHGVLARFLADPRYLRHARERRRTRAASRTD